MSAMMTTTGAAGTTTIYTWSAGSDSCYAEAHRTSPTCLDCEDCGTCADCGQPVSGPRHLYCDQNGEVVHVGCSPQAASADWVDYW